MANGRTEEVSVWSVWELTRSIRSLLESKVGTVWVEGEISNYRRQASGHQYFTLKDDRSQLPCVFFRGDSEMLPPMALADGQCVQVYGSLTVYELRGQYQMVVQLVQARGAGALQARFEALKRKLNAEGLFDPARKKRLPAFPATIGIVTSPTGAALQDMLNVLKRRAPGVRIVVYPVRVQGAGAAMEITQAVRDFSRWARPEVSPELLPRALGKPAVDLIVLARGGGSMEDLFEFNDELLARAIAASALPVVSAVGHEIDFTIADFVADLRAPTPSAAAEMIVPDTVELQRQLLAAGQFMQRQLRAYLERARAQVAALARSGLMREPVRRLLEARQRLDHSEEGLRRRVQERLRQWRERVEEQRRAMRGAGAVQVLALRRQEVKGQQERLRGSLEREVARLRARARESQRLLSVLGPEATLERGYSITTNAEGQVIYGASEVAPGESLITRLRAGRLVSTVDTVEQ